MNAVDMFLEYRREKIKIIKLSSRVSNDIGGLLFHPHLTLCIEQKLSFFFHEVYWRGTELMCLFFTK